MIVGVLKSWTRQKGKWGLHHSTASMLCHHPAPWWLSLNSKPKRKDSIWAICNQENKSSCVTPKAEHITPPSFPSKPNFPEKHKKSQPISWISNPENLEKSKALSKTFLKPFGWFYSILKPLGMYQNLLNGTCTKVQVWDRFLILWGLTKGIKIEEQ